MNTESCPIFSKCPRCGSRSFEYFKEHDCCHNCNYSSDYSLYKDLDPVPEWALENISSYEQENFVEQKVLPSSPKKKKKKTEEAA